LNCVKKSQIIKLVSFTNSNVSVSLLCCWNFTNKFEIKKTDNSDDFCKMFVFISFYSFSYSKKTIFVHLSVKKKWMILIIHNEKLTLQRMYINFLYNKLSKTSVRFKLSIKIIHFEIVFQTVITHEISSFSAVKVNHCLCVFI